MRPRDGLAAEPPISPRRWRRRGRGSPLRPAARQRQPPASHPPLMSEAGCTSNSCVEMATTVPDARGGRCMLSVGLAVGHLRSGSRSRSQLQMLARSQSQVLSSRCCRSCACFRFCFIPGTCPAAPLWTSQARRGPCPPTSTTAQATRTQEHEDASFLRNTLGRAPAAILGPGPCLPSHRPPNGNGSAGDARSIPSRSPVLSTELEREVDNSAGLRDP